MLSQTNNRCHRSQSVMTSFLVSLLFVLCCCSSCHHREQLQSVSNTRLSSSLLTTEVANLFSSISITDTVLVSPQFFSIDTSLMSVDTTSPYLVPAVIRRISARHVAQLSDTSSYAADVAVSDSSVSRQLSEYSAAETSHSFSYLIIVISLVVCFIIVHVFYTHRVILRN